MPKNVSNQVNFKGFAQIQLSESDVKALDEHTANPEPYVTAVLGLVAMGYKVALSRDSDSGLYTATLFDNRPSSPTAGWMLSGDADSIEAAMVVLAYKHFNKADSVWLPFLQTGKPAFKYR